MTMTEFACPCGKPATEKLHLHYTYPRAVYEADATDPERIHGGGYSVFTCGDVGCEAGGFVAVRDQIISDISWLIIDPDDIDITVLTP